MELDKFLSTVYLGDRWCKAITLDGERKRVCVRVDCISRIRNPSGDWGYYADEDIEEGSLVFDRVTSFGLVPAGPLPNDTIRVREVVRVPVQDEAHNSTDAWRIVFSLGTWLSNTQPLEIVATIIAESVHLEDPSRPGLKITE